MAHTTIVVVILTRSNKKTRGEARRDRNASGYLRGHVYTFSLFSEGALTHEISSLKTTAARLKFKGIDGGLHKRWSMWFNSKQRAEPYQSLQYTEDLSYVIVFGIQALHGCRQLVA